MVRAAAAAPAVATQRANPAVAPYLRTFATETAPSKGGGGVSLGAWWGDMAGFADWWLFYLAARDSVLLDKRMHSSYPRSPCQSGCWNCV